jgi:hypothetical protein
MDTNPNSTHNQSLFSSTDPNPNPKINLYWASPEFSGFQIVFGFGSVPINPTRTWKSKKIWYRSLVTRKSGLAYIGLFLLEKCVCLRNQHVRAADIPSEVTFVSFNKDFFTALNAQVIILSISTRGVNDIDNIDMISIYSNIPIYRLTKKANDISRYISEKSEKFVRFSLVII